MLPIKVKEYGDKVILNYDQIGRPKDHPIVRECRQLILKKHTWEVVAQSFERFFNLYEVDGDQDKTFQFGWAEEKWDGSIISFYHDEVNAKFQPATRSTDGDAETPMGHKFEDLFWQAAGDRTAFKYFELCALWHEQNIKNLVFELVGPANRVVTRYEKTDLCLIGGRHNDEEGMEMDSFKLNYIAERLGVNRPKKLFFKTIEEAHAYVNGLEAEKEGIVLVREYGRYPHHDRRKLKNNKYLAISKVRNGGVITPKRILNLIQTDGYDEYLLYFPEDEPSLRPFWVQYEGLLAELDRVWDKCKDIEDRKEFALAIQAEIKFTSPLFARYNGKTDSFRDFLTGVNPDSILSHMEKLDERNCNTGIV